MDVYIRLVSQRLAVSVLLLPIAAFAQTGASCDSRVHLGACNASLSVSGNSVTITADANCALIQWHADVNSFSDTVTDGSLTKSVSLLPASLKNAAVDSCTILKDLRASRSGQTDILADLGARRSSLALPQISETKVSNSGGNMSMATIPRAIISAGILVLASSGLVQDAGSTVGYGDTLMPSVYGGTRLNTAQLAAQANLLNVFRFRESQRERLLILTDYDQPDPYVPAPPEGPEFKEVPPNRPNCEWSPYEVIRGALAQCGADEGGPRPGVFLCGLKPRPDHTGCEQFCIFKECKEI
jgi:hypothetical protein